MLSKQAQTPHMALPGNLPVREQKESDKVGGAASCEMSPIKMSHTPIGYGCLLGGHCLTAGQEAETCSAHAAGYQNRLLVGHSGVLQRWCLTLWPRGQSQAPVHMWQSQLGSPPPQRQSLAQ